MALRQLVVIGRSAIIRMRVCSVHV